MNILDEIIAYKFGEVSDAKSRVPVSALEKSEFFKRSTVSLSRTLLSDGKSGIIAEIKRKSPSKGELNPAVSVQKVSTGYIGAGASALSVLTDQKYFGGTNDDLITARRLNQCPILRKDFTVDEYQIVEAKSIGADAILLIAGALSAKRASELARFAHSLGLEVLLEVHNEKELDQTSSVDADLIGVNNRDLKTFDVSIITSVRLAPLIRDGVVKVAESGISDPAAIVELRRHGYRGFLIGETFMKTPSPESTARQFIDKLLKHGEIKA